MGLKLLNMEEVSTIPVAILDGVLTYEFGGKTYERFIPKLKGQTFQKQHRTYLSGNILAYLVNTTYKVVLYYSGVGVILINDNFFLKFNYELPEFPNLQKVPGNPVLVSYSRMKNLSSHCSVYLEQGTSNMVMFSDNCTSTVEFNGDANLDFLNDFKGTVAYPCIVYENGRMVKAHEPGKFDYELKGTLHYSDLIIL